MSLAFPILEIDVPHVDQYWLAAKKDAPWLADVDAEEGQKHTDRDSLNWAEIGRAAQGFGIAIAEGDFVKSSYWEDWVSAGVVSPRGPKVPLHAEERRIVQTLFDRMEGVRADAGWNSVENGRHRAWNIWLADSSLLLPIRSSVLANRPDIDFPMRELQGYAAEVLPHVSSSAQLRNPRYYKALSERARDGV